MSEINRDVVPSSLDHAVDIIVAGLSADDVEFFETESTTRAHHEGGRFLRNTWSLWDKESHLVQWFRTHLGISHADDISSVILVAVQARVIGIKFYPTPMLDRFREHWAKLGCNSFGEKEIQDDDG